MEFLYGSLRIVTEEKNVSVENKRLSEQKRFLQQHKQRSETYSKAAATMKKQRKKNKGTTKTGLAMDKELKNMQVLEEEKSKLDAFCEQSLKTAMTQERRRYGFVLERQCSLAKHYLAYHNQGSNVLQRHLDDWQEVAQTREFLPDSVEVMFTNRLRQVSFWPDEDLYSSPRSPNVEDDRLSIASQLRKTKSMDASCLDMRSINDATSPMKPLSRAKSDFNLTASTHSLVQDPDTPTRPKSMAVPDRGSGWDTQLARAMYAYLSSGDNQLSFLEGDIIALMGDRNKGWQFGENLRTQCSGWFPLAYTELILDDTSSPTHQRMQSMDSTGSSTAATTPATPTAGGFGLTSPSGPSGSSHNQQQTSSLLSGKSGVPSSDNAGATSPRPSAAATPVTMFGDTLLHHRASAAAKQVGSLKHPVAFLTVRYETPIPLDQKFPTSSRYFSASNAGPPPTLPPPVPTPKVPASSTLPVARGVAERRLIHPPPMPPLPMLGNVKRPPGAIGSGIGNASLHSSNDSGFSNDPPPAPEVDYSDDDSTRSLRHLGLNATTQKPVRRKQVVPANGTSEDRDSVTTRNLVQKRKKQLLSSVRGWLLYKSALDLWDDVNTQHINGPPINNQHMNSLPNNKQSTGSPPANDKRPLALRQASSVGHLATLGRYNGDKRLSERQASMTLPTDAQRPPQIKSMELLATSEKKSYITNGNGSGAMVKRSKSLWKFKRFNRDDEGILEGMSLWQHRSLVDVHVAVQQEEQTASSTPTIVKKKSTATNTSITLEEKSTNEKSPTPLMRTKIMPMKVDEGILNGHNDIPPKPMERKSVKQAQNGGKQSTHEYNGSNTISTIRNSPPPPPKKPAPRNTLDMNDDDGLLIMRSNQQRYCSSDEDELEDEVDGEDENTDPENGDSESCIVVDDHMKAKISLSRKQQIIRESTRTPLETAPRLPRTRLLKSRNRKNRDVEEEEEPPPADGLLYYGRTLQYRLKKPERGSRFDQVSQTTGNMYGPWYDLWGIDPSVRQ
ncbi:hypothetical protein C0J52_12123 [Blattella germanica]|nr:hypothetical protein C0J52_12123 [Blattella germanica]